MAIPIPLLPPVTMATLSLRFMALLLVMLKVRSAGWVMPLGGQAGATGASQQGAHRHGWRSPSR